jgi:hypothetical protein
MRTLSAVGSVVSAAALLTPAPMLVAVAGVAIASAAHAIDLPAHRTLQGEVQPDEYLERGLSFGTGGFHVASLLAPIAAFPLAATVGAPITLLVSAAIFVAASVPAFLLPRTPCARAGMNVPRDVAASLRFVRRTPLVLALLFATTLPSMIDKAVAITLPSQAGAADHAHVMGLLLAAPELGAIAVGFLLAAVQWRFAPWITLLSACAYATGIATATLAGLTVGVEAVALALFIAGCAKTTLITSALAGMQRHVPEHMRGRIMTI